MFSSFAPASLPADKVEDTDVVLTPDDADAEGDVAAQRYGGPVCVSASGHLVR